MSTRFPMYLALVLLLSLALACVAEEEAFGKVGDYLRELEGFAVDVDFSMLMKDAGHDEELSHQIGIALKRPNLLSLSIKNRHDGSVLLSIVCDGEHKYLLSPAENKYTEEEAPDDLPAVLTEMAGGPLAGGFKWLAELLSDAPFEKWRKDVGEPSYAASEEDGGVQRDRFKAAAKAYDADIWVDAGEKPLLARAAFDMAKMIKESSRGAEMPDAQLKLSFVFKNWAVDDVPDAGLFRFTPPEGAEKAEAPGEAPETSSLLGKPAPVFTLDLLGGGQMDLAAHKGKDVVLLDFWASWCGPCRMAMPVVSEVTSAYKDKGVVFYAVNQGESEDKIKGFLEQTKLSLTVALDKDSKVGALYGVRGIPHSVIIGKDGTVQAVHSGFGPDLKATLDKELAALVKGEKLVE